MKNKEILDFLKEKKAMEEIIVEFKEIEGIEQTISDLVDKFHVRLLEEDGKNFYETINNDFKKSTVKKIGELACYICMNPKCRRFTLAPSMNHPDKIINIGEAAHIYGNKPNSPRFHKEHSTPNIENGLWLCRLCHKMIDANKGVDYPNSILLDWKKQHAVWLRDSLNRPYDLVRSQNWISYLEWKDYILRHNRFLFKIETYISNYSQKVLTILDNAKYQDQTSIRILGPQGVGKKTILIEALEKYPEEQKRMIFVYFKENESILNKKFINNTIIIIQECSNKFHRDLLEKLKFDQIKNVILITLGTDYRYKGIDITSTEIITLEGLDIHQTELLLEKNASRMSYSELKKIHEWSSGIPGLVLDFYNLFKKEGDKLENIDNFNQFWDEKLNSFIKNYGYSRNEVINLLNKIALVFHIPYSWDLDLFRSNYLPWLSESNIELTQQLIKDLLSEQLLKERDGSLSIFPPLVSIHLIRKNVDDDHLIEFLQQIIKLKRSSLLDSFIQQITFLDNISLSNRVAFTLAGKIEYNVDSLNDNFISHALYRLSEIFPKEVLSIIKSCIQKSGEKELSHINDKIFDILIILAEKSEFYFVCFNILLEILAGQWVYAIEENLGKITQLFFKSEIGDDIKKDFIKSMNLAQDNGKKYIIVFLLTSIIKDHGIYPGKLIEADKLNEEELENIRKYKERVKFYLKEVWNILLSIIDLENRKSLRSYLENINREFLPIYCSGLWENLLNLWNRVLDKHPELKISFLKAIRFSSRFKDFSNEKDFASLESFYRRLKNELDTFEELEWFIHYESVFDDQPHGRDFELKRTKYFVQFIISNSDIQRELFTFLHKQESYKVADIGAKLGEMDNTFNLWSLIEASFLENIEQSSTDFINGYSYVIFENDETMWDEILIKFEKISDLKPKLWQILIPKLPYKKNLDLLRQLYDQNYLTSENLRRIIYSFRKDKITIIQEDEQIEMFKFYFDIIENPLDGVELYYIKEWMETKDFLIPNELKSYLLEVLTSFDKIDQRQSYLASIWDEILDAIREKDVKYYEGLRKRILEKIQKEPKTLLFDRISRFMNKCLSDEYDGVISIIKSLIKEYLLISPDYISLLSSKLDINLLKIDDLLELSKLDNPKILSWIFKVFINELLQNDKIPVFFEELLKRMPYNQNIINSTYKSILRSNRKDEGFNDYLRRTLNHLKNLLEDVSEKNVQYWLNEVIQALERKL